MLLQDASGKSGEGVFSSGASTPSVAESKVGHTCVVHAYFIVMKPSNETKQCSTAIKMIHTGGISENPLS